MSFDNKIKFPLWVYPQTMKDQIIKIVADMQSTQQPKHVNIPAIQQKPDNTETIPDDRPESVEETADSVAPPETTTYSSMQKSLAHNTVMALLFDTARMIEASYDQNRRSALSHADSKLRRTIRRKKRELGIKEESTQGQTQ